MFLKRVIMKSHFKYLVSTKALRCLTQNREEYSAKDITMGWMGSVHRLHLWYPTYYFLTLINSKSLRSLLLSF